MKNSLEFARRHPNLSIAASALVLAGCGAKPQPVAEHLANPNTPAVSNNSGNTGNNQPAATATPEATPDSSSSGGSGEFVCPPSLDGYNLQGSALSIEKASDILDAAVDAPTNAQALESLHISAQDEKNALRSKNVTIYKGLDFLNNGENATPITLDTTIDSRTEGGAIAHFSC